MTTTLSAKYQIVIPKEIRNVFQWKPGTEFMILPDGPQSVRIFVVQKKPIKKLRGIAKGMDTTLSREPDRKL